MLDMMAVIVIQIAANLFSAGRLICIQHEQFKGSDKFLSWLNHCRQKKNINVGNFKNGGEKKYVDWIEVVFD